MEEKRKKSTKSGFILATIIGAVIGAIIGVLMALFIVPLLFGINPIKLYSGQLTGNTIITKTTNTPVTAKTDSSEVATQVASKVGPSVVNVSTKTKVASFLGEEQYGTGIASGLIYSEDGYIITNYHVVQGADKVWVYLVNQGDIEGQVVGVDPLSDVALIKVDKKGLKSAVFGTSKDLQVGQKVIAIGNPYGLDHTVTEGIISALHRTIQAGSEASPTTLGDLIQTDAPINPGNSGGALCAKSGEVIGINTAIYSQTGGYQGIGFALPVGTVKNVVEQLLTKGKVSHPYIGMTGQTVNQEVAETYNLSVKSGAMAVEVYSESPCDKAGIKKGDIITSFDNVTINTMDELINEIQKRKVGTTVKVKYVRGSNTYEVKITLAEKPVKIAP